MAFIRSFMVAD